MVLPLGVCFLTCARVDRLLIYGNVILSGGAGGAQCLNLFPSRTNDRLCFRRLFIMTVAKAPRRSAAARIGSLFATPLRSIFFPPLWRAAAVARSALEMTTATKCALVVLAGRGSYPRRGRKGRNRCSTADLFLFCPCQSGAAARPSVFPSAADDVLWRVPRSDTDACARKYRLPASGRHRSRSHAAVAVRSPEK